MLSKPDYAHAVSIAKAHMAKIVSFTMLWNVCLEFPIGYKGYRKLETFVTNR